MKVLWEKKMSKTDAQRQLGNPTGHLRLTCANFKSNGKKIDQTTYFRKVVFRGQQWVKIEENIPKEICEVEFKIYIDGIYRGMEQLIVIHNPKWESNQKNFTTGLRLGNWLNHVFLNEINCTGKILTISHDGVFILDIR